MVAVDQGIHFSGTFCHWHEGQFLETLIVSLFRSVYLFKNLESLNTVSDLKEIERHRAV